MSWPTVLAACLACYVLKLAGWLVPHRLLQRPRVVRIAALVTVALLSALFAVQTLVSDGGLVLDARVPAICVAIVLLWRRAPFIVVVAAAALVAAVLRLLGWAA